MVKFHKTLATISVGKNAKQKEKMMKDFEEECKCNLDFSKKSQYYALKHYKTIHLGYQKCPKCIKLLKEQNTKHICRDKSKQNQQILVNAFRCDECNVVRNTKLGLNDHIQTIHKPETLVQCKL